MSAEKMPKVEDSKFAEIKAKLVDQAMHVREELVKAAESLKGNPAVVKGIELYDAQVKMLHDAQNSEMAQRIMDMLNKAKETIVATIETVAAMPITKDIMARLADYQTKAKQTLENYQGGGTKTA